MHAIKSDFTDGLPFKLWVILCFCHVHEAENCSTLLCEKRYTPVRVCQKLRVPCLYIQHKCLKHLFRNLSVYITMNLKCMRNFIISNKSRQALKHDAVSINLELGIQYVKLNHAASDPTNNSSSSIAAFRPINWELLFSQVLWSAVSNYWRPGWFAVSFSFTS